MDLFDLLPEDEAKKYKPLQSTDWKWTMSNDYPKEKNGLKVFSCFACGGGSTMGYKLAGCEVIGCLEIDKKMNDIYLHNHHPKHNFLMDIRDFNKIPNEKLPKELFNIDILDGSPPCTTFSMAGDREESWGKKKKFREGQQEQTLDDLSFVFIETVKKLKPKTVIMENVEGLLMGNAWGYVQRIYLELNSAGYKVKHFLLKGEEMGIPQTRHRVFFICVRNDIEFNLYSLKMSFYYEKVPYGKIRTGEGLAVGKETKTYQLLNECKPNELDLSGANERLYGKNGLFQSAIIDNDAIMPTIRAKMTDMFRRDTKERVSVQDVINSQTFPQDYDFMPNSAGQVGYVCGMSVPPVMTKRVVTRLIESGLYGKR